MRLAGRSAPGSRRNRAPITSCESRAAKGFKLSETIIGGGLDEMEHDARRPVAMTINGQVRSMTIEPRTTLLTALREELGR